MLKPMGSQRVRHDLMTVQLQFSLSPDRSTREFFLDIDPENFAWLTEVKIIEVWVPKGRIF